MPKEDLQRAYGLSTSTYVVIASMVGTGILVLSLIHISEPTRPY